MQTTNKKKQKQQINVYIRQRPLSKQEIEECSPCIIEIPNVKHVCVKHNFNEKFYQFDHVFGPDGRQENVYDIVLEPLIAEVLEGFNCTVFAYGQTGTGKTYTISGNPRNISTSLRDDPEAGLITRATTDIFKRLSKPSVLEYAVRVSFIELYNEELKDLLREQNENFLLRIFDDPKQKGAIVIQNLFEQTVCSEEDIFTLLQEGMEKRKTASTLINDQSSRSHSVFTINIHMKELLPSGEEVIKTGKLNLVDLAGSENIGRSGAVNVRAREAGNINQSLLTLGRVIKALVEQQPHIPYRDSKLTRILQDSLGGRTKTSIIATISPSLACIEETVSTLDYAKRACGIMNCPEANKKSSKERAILMLSKELDRLQKDIAALRTGSGFYVHTDNYNNLIEETKANDKIISSHNEAISKLEKQIAEIQQEIEQEEKRWDELMEAFNFTKLKTKEYKLKKLKSEAEKKVQKNLIVLYEERGKVITEKNQTLIQAADYSTNVIKDAQRNIDLLYKKSKEDFKSYEQIMNVLDDTKQTAMNEIENFKNKHEEHILDINKVGNKVLQLSSDICNTNKNYDVQFDKLELEKQKSKINRISDQQMTICVEEKQCITDELQKLNNHVKAGKESTFCELLGTSIPNFTDNVKAQSSAKIETHNTISSDISDIRKFQMDHLQQAVQDLTDYESKTNNTLASFKNSFVDSIKQCNDEIEVLQFLKNKIENMLNEKDDEIKELTKLVDDMENIEVSISKGVQDRIKTSIQCCEQLMQIPDQVKEITEYKIQVNKSVANIEKEVSEFIDDSNTCQTAIDNGLKEIDKSYMASLLHQRYAHKIEERRLALMNNITAIQTMIKESSNSTEGMCNTINSTISSVNSLSQEINYHEKGSEEIRQHLTDQNTELPNMHSLDKRLLKLEPTGDTPKRQEYKYEKELIDGVPACRHSLLEADVSVGPLDISNSVSSDLELIEDMLREENISFNESLSCSDVESSPCKKNIGITANK